MASADRDALEALFRSTGGENWRNNRNWATDADLSTWVGVKVDNGRVVGLFLYVHDLQGPIPEALGALTDLTELDLSSNKLTGPIPEVLQTLTKLRGLSLRSSAFTSGPIPEWLRDLTNLTTLNLACILTGPIPEWLGALTNLTELGLSRNQLSGPIPGALGALTNLQTLSLKTNKLEGRIPGVLGALIQLEDLNLSNNKLEGPIPDALGALSNLLVLKLSTNQLTGPIPEWLGGLTNLFQLHLSENQLTGSIPGALGALIQLEDLNLSNNKLEGTVPLSVWKLPGTKRVDLSDNLLTHLTDPEEKTASTRVVMGCMERIRWLTKGLLDPMPGLFVEGNPWEFPPAAVVANGQESIRKYYNTWEQCGFGVEEIHSLKVVVVGAYGAGKTSLARSIQMGRGDRTPDEDENGRTTVGVDIHSHNLRGTECKIYDVAGQITYYGLHQFFLTERAVYVLVFDATKFEGLSAEPLDEAIEKYILEWISLLHMRTPLCTVMLVASHYDMLKGAPEESKEMLVTVHERFLELHTKWKSWRHDQISAIDTRMTVLPGVFPVSCKLASESAADIAGDGLQAVDEALSKQTVVVSRVPPSWVAARYVLGQVGGGEHDDSSGGTTAVDGRDRPWLLRSDIHSAFQSFVEESRRGESQRVGQQHWASCLSRLQEDGISPSCLSRLDEDGIRLSMDGAIELRAFSGMVISHDDFVVLDVTWLALVLKPILDHRGITEKKEFAGRVLATNQLLRYADDLVGRGILRNGFACFLWRLKEQATESVDDPHGMEPAMFAEILNIIGATIPLPVDEDAASNASPAEDAKSSENSIHGGARRDGADFLVIMRLPPEADAETRGNLLVARQAAFPDDSSGEKRSLKAVFEFDHAGAPHGLPERVMALSHKIGNFSPKARWRLGGLFLLHHHGISISPAMILEYDKKRKTLCIEALGQDTPHIQAVQFVISALYHVARDFPGASWTGWMGCGMSHDNEKMYLLATSNDKQDQNPGSEVVPVTRDSPWARWSKPQNLCGMQGFDARGSCTIDPDVFGKVVDVKQPYPPQEVPGPLLPDPPQADEEPSGRRDAYKHAFVPFSGKIAGVFFPTAAGFFYAATAVDDAKRATLRVCFGLAALSLLVALVAVFVFIKDKIAEGRKRDQQRPNRADQSDLGVLGSAV